MLNQNQLGKERTYFILQLIVHHEGKSRQELKAGSRGQKLKWRPWRNNVSWFASHVLLSRLSYVPQDHLSRDGAAQGGLGPSHQLLIKKMSFRIAYRPG